ncbi:uncharacterized protein V6R79_007789 [Siganus canaliculatus]
MEREWREGKREGKEGHETKSQRSAERLQHQSISVMESISADGCWGGEFPKRHIRRRGSSRTSPDKSQRVSEPVCRFLAQSSAQIRQVRQQRCSSIINAQFIPSKAQYQCVPLICETYITKKNLRCMQVETAAEVRVREWGCQLDKGTVRLSFGFAARTDLVPPELPAFMAALPSCAAGVRRGRVPELGRVSGRPDDDVCLLGGADTDGTVPSDPGGQQRKSRSFLKDILSECVHSQRATLT